jgi:hypothetical protein
MLAALISMAVLTAATTVRAASPLRWQFNEGETLDYAVLQQLDMLINFNGAEMNVEMKQIFDITWDVGGVKPDGTATISQKITRLQVEANSPFTGEVAIDSKAMQEGGVAPPGPVGEMANRMIEMLIGQQFTLTVASNGEVSQIVLPEKLAAQLKNEGNGEGRGRGQMGALFGGDMSADAVEQLIRRVVQRLPDNGTADSPAPWKQQFVEKLGPLGTKTSNIAYNYAGREGELDRIDIGTEIVLELSGDDSGEIDMEIQEQESAGHSLFDAVKGRLVSSVVVEKLVMEGILGDNEMVRDSTSTLRVVAGGSENLVDESPAEETEEIKEIKETDDDDDSK